MKHHDRNTKFGRPRDQRIALMRSLARSLIVRERIETTEPKAKALRPFIERLITKARQGDLAARRLVAARLGDSSREAKKLVDDIAPRYKDRAGGYTRITKLPQRSGDGAKMAVIEFVKE